MIERPALVAGAELRNGIRFTGDAVLPSERQSMAASLLDDWQAEMAQDLPLGLMFDATDTPVIVDGMLQGIDRVAKIVPVA